MIAGSHRILVVEDDPLIGTLVQVNLEHEGYSVVWVERAEDGLSALAQQPFSLVILDYMLPGMDGHEALSEMRARAVTSPVLMLTARAEVHLKVRALDRGADDYLTKPFEVPELLARVRALLRRGLQP